MKVEQTFSPLTIVLETKEEVALLYYLSSRTGFCHLENDIKEPFYAKINWLASFDIQSFNSAQSFLQKALSGALYVAT